VDHLTPAGRSKVMSKIRSRNTRPEMIVRKYLHSLGYRFRLHRKDLAGRPDIVLPRFKTAIWVHGCFWHSHSCPSGKLPKTNIDYWHPKLAGNVARDFLNKRKLSSLGWMSFVLWECEILSPSKFLRRMDILQRRMLSRAPAEISGERKVSN
jgi:DNA mismatch endonuclease (patch repair protein)